MILRQRAHKPKAPQRMGKTMGKTIQDDGRGLFSSFSCFHFAERSCFANFAHQIQRRALRRGKNRTIWQPFLVSVQSLPQRFARVRIYMVSMARYGALSVRTSRAPSLLH